MNRRIPGSGGLKLSPPSTGPRRLAGSWSPSWWPAAARGPATRPRPAAPPRPRPPPPTPPALDHGSGDLRAPGTATTARPPAPVRYRFPVAGCQARYGTSHHDYPAADMFTARGCTFVAPVDGRVDEVARTDNWTPASDRGADRGGRSVSLVGVRRRPLLRLPPGGGRPGDRPRGQGAGRAAAWPDRQLRLGQGDPRPPALRDLLADPPRHLVGAAGDGPARALPGLLAGRRRPVPGPGGPGGQGRGRPRGARVPGPLLSAGGPVRRDAAASWQAAQTPAMAWWVKSGRNPWSRSTSRSRLRSELRGSSRSAPQREQVRWACWTSSSRW